jgi:proline dehydrogenase
MSENHPVSFDDTAIAFAGKSNKELNNAYLLFKSIGNNFLVKAGPSMVNLGLKLHLPITGLIKSTIFAHFCGGESISDCAHAIKQLSEYGVGTILDYSVEGEESEKGFDACEQETLATIARAKGDKAIPFCVFKVTGLARFALLEKLNDSNETLTADEKREYEKVKSRIDNICKAAFNADVPILIDAEETWIQNSIDNLAESMKFQYNKEKAIVYNTIQMYRVEGLDLLKTAHKKAIENAYFLGIKLVRGAYMEKERARAEKMGYPSPIQPNKAATDADYNDGLHYCAENVDSIALCAGTHNEESSMLLISLMEQHKISHKDKHIYFSQLLGMSDHISFNVANAGYNVAKYVPYGPVKAVLPYLFRRANENTSISGQMGRELSLIVKERKRRKLEK